MHTKNISALFLLTQFILVLEVASGEYGDLVETLSKKSENGLGQEWRKRQRNSLQFQSIEHIGKQSILSEKDRVCLGRFFR